MPRIKNSTVPATKRGGVILLVVLAMLTIFAIVGLTFVFYAESSASSSRSQKLAEAAALVDTEPELLFSYFLAQLIYGTDDVYSSLRGHDLARTMYGYVPTAQNDNPFNGVGRLRYQFTPPPPLPGNPALPPNDNFKLVNYQYYPGDNFLRDPGIFGFRTGPTAMPDFTKYAGENVPYTYPDLNNMCLAQVDSQGRVLIPSFRRSWNEGSAGDPWAKYLTLRPHKSYHGAQWDDPPNLADCDVKNLDNSPGLFVNGTLFNNDSIWIDLGFPVMTAQDGRKFKPLFAPLILDLDGLINLNVHGNIKNNGTSASNMGIGRWEVNPAKVLFADPKEYENLFIGNKGQVAGRYGKQPYDPVTGNPIGPKPRPGTAITPLTPDKYPPHWSRFDFDGLFAGKLALPGGYPLPGGGWTVFPGYPGGWDYRQPVEVTDATGQPDHPAGYNYWNPTGGNKRWDPSHQEAFMRFRGTNSPALTSELFRLLPKNMSNEQVQRLVTLLSMDMDRPGLMPYVSYKATDVTGYMFDAANPSLTYPYMKSGARPGLAFPTPPGPLPPGTEFGSDWRSELARFPKINLNRRLREFPRPTPPKLLDPADPLYNEALTDRRKFAQDIYTGLIFATGAKDPNQATMKNIADSMQPDYEAARWLAQLAVNIVDYIDNDDYMTPFLWNGNWAGSIGGPPEWLFGTELPRLVINEVYAQMDNDPLDPGVATAATYFKLNVWAELFNPFKLSAEMFPRDNGKAKLVNIDPTTMAVTNIPYKLVLIKQDPNLRKRDNAKGEPQAVLTTDGTIPCEVDDWDDPMTPNILKSEVVPVIPEGGYSGTPTENKGFYVIGPTPNDEAVPANNFLPGRDPGFATTQKSKKLSAKIMPIDKNEKFSVLLRRLANPDLPYNPVISPDPAFGNTYVTVDYIDKITIGAGILNGIKKDENGADMAMGLETGQSLGRKQPYAADMGLTQADPYDATKSQWLRQEPLPPPPVDPPAPKHTLYRHNAQEAIPGPVVPAPPGPNPNPTPTQTLKMPFDWLVHLDRQVTSPLELLHVSAFRPHELTQQFVKFVPDATGVALVERSFLHYAPWIADPADTNSVRGQESLLHRFLELVGVPDLMDGQALYPGNGRRPGLININTIQDYRVLQALCDALGPPFSDFDDAYVQQLFTKLVQSRNGSTPTVPQPNPYTGNDRPFLPLGVGYTPMPSQQFPTTGLGLQDTILRDDPTVPAAPKPKLFELQSASHPYTRDALLNKIYNNVTTRSNCFAVWLTVGFFEVVDETARPVKLGKEIGKSENRHIRHRMFAIIDRTNLQIRPLWFNTTDKDTGWRVVNYEPTTGEVTGQSLDSRPDLNFQTRNGPLFPIQVGTQLQVFPDTPFEETVTVTTPPVGNQFKFNLRNPLPVPLPFNPVNQTIISRGNPGPWLRYAVRQDPLVVPHFSIIE
ncbi:MAG: hypothetical protein L0Y72_31350 [Gemmataceae bacterium]|nr:hypothetical protein [Gemmataceae bacterium]